MDLLGILEQGQEVVIAHFLSRVQGYHRENPRT